MKFGHIVSFNGVWYPAGTDVPVPGAAIENQTEEALTKTDINRMPVAELRELCEKEGIAAEDLSGSDMKKLLIEKYQL